MQLHSTRLNASALIVATIFLHACAFNNSAAPAVTRINPSSTYQLPLKYEDHQSLQQRFDSVSGEIAYTDHGSGEALVLLHGVPTSSWMYRKIIPSLQTSFRVISIDLPGYGSSAKPQDDKAAYRPARQADVVQALLSELGVDRYVLTLHDMGGLVGWELMRRGANISDLIVFNTIVRDEGFEQPDIEESLMAELQAEAISNSLTSKILLKNTFGSLGLDMDTDLTEDEAMGYITPVKEGSDEAIYAFYTSMDSQFFLQLESNAAVFDLFEGDTLVLWGGKDKTLTTSQIPFLQEHLRIPPEQVMIFDNSGHFLMEEIPMVISEEITNFLDN